MVGSKLKKLRNQHKYTISQLCDMLNLNPNTYAKYERDERDVSTDTLSKLANFYNVSTDYLLGRGTGEQTALDELAGQFSMSLLEKKIVENYLALDEKMRGDLMEFLAKTVKEVAEESKPKPLPMPKPEEDEPTLMISRSADDRPPELKALTPEQRKRLREAPDETQNPDNDL